MAIGRALEDDTDGDQNCEYAKSSCRRTCHDFTIDQGRERLSVCSKYTDNKGTEDSVGTAEYEDDVSRSSLRQLVVVSLLVNSKSDAVGEQRHRHKQVHQRGVMHDDVHQRVHIDLWYSR